MDANNIGRVGLSPGRQKTSPVVFGILHGVVDFDVGIGALVICNYTLQDRARLPESPVGECDGTRTFGEELGQDSKT